MTIYLYGWADLDFDTVSQYVITITANDGTDTTVSTLTVDLIEHIVLYPSKYFYGDIVCMFIRQIIMHIACKLDKLGILMNKC